MPPVLVVPRDGRGRAAPLRQRLPAAVATSGPALTRAPFIVARASAAGGLFLLAVDVVGQQLTSWPVALAGIGAPTSAPTPGGVYGNNTDPAELVHSPDLAFVGAPGDSAVDPTLFTGHVQIWAGTQFDAEQLEFPLSGIDPAPTAQVAWSPGGGVVATALRPPPGSPDPQTRAWPWSAGTLGAEFAAPPALDRPVTVQFAPGGTHIAYGSILAPELVVLVWSDVTGWGVAIANPAVFVDSIFDIRWSPAGAHVALLYDNFGEATAGLQVWEWTGAAFGAAVPVHAGVTLGSGRLLSWHPGGAWLAGPRGTTADFQFMPFDGLSVGAPLVLTSTVVGSGALGVLFSPDGEFAALVSTLSGPETRWVDIYSGAAAGPGGMTLVGTLELAELSAIGWIT